MSTVGAVKLTNRDLYKDAVYLVTHGLISRWFQIPHRRFHIGVPEPLLHRRRSSPSQQARKFFTLTCRQLSIDSLTKRSPRYGFTHRPQNPVSCAAVGKPQSHDQAKKDENVIHILFLQLECNPDGVLRPMVES
jgi:hypothetical protein